MAQLTDGVRLKVSAIKRGALLLGGRPARAWPAIRRADGLRLAVIARRAGSVPLVRSADALRLGWRARAAGVSAAVGAGLWRSAVAGIRQAMSGGRGQGVRLVIAPPMRGGTLRAAGRVAGPGASAAEAAYELPPVWRDAALPADYIGEALAGLALVRGEPVALVDTALHVGGRVVIDTSGTALRFDAAGAERWMSLTALDAEKALGIVWARPGAERLRRVSERRERAAKVVRRIAKGLPGVVDPARRAALVADLDFIQLGV